MKLIEKLFNNPYLYNLAQSLFGISFYITIKPFLEKYLHKSVLEIGCGTGNILKYITPDRYIGIDINENYLNYARKKYRKKDVNFFSLEAQKLKKINKHFDLIIMINVLHHLSPKEFKTIIKRLLSNIKFSRFLIIDSEPNIGRFGWLLKNLDQGDHFRGLDKILQTLAQYFTIEKALVLKKPYWIYKYPMIVAKSNENLKILEKSKSYNILRKNNTKKSMKARK